MGYGIWFAAPLFLVGYDLSSCDALSVSPTSQQVSLPQPLLGVIFDMDGTLIEPSIDFADMRSRIYEIASNEFGRTVNEGDVVEMVMSFPTSAGRSAAKAVFDDIEEKARLNMKLMPGMVELCKYLDENNIKRALLTRNVETSVDYLYEKHMKSASLSKFEPAIARNSVDSSGELILPKPNPDAILFICDQWGCDPSQVMMVGDSEKDDVVAANRAGCGGACWLQTGEDNDSGSANESLASERQPSLIIKSLTELQDILERAYCNII